MLDMEAYLSNKTALYAHGVQGLDTIFGEPIGHHSLIHITIPSYSKRRKRDGFEIHYTDGSKLPPDSLWNYGSNLIASPAHAFVQMGTELSIVRLIMLGYQLCAYPNGPYSNQLCRLQDLEQYIERADNMKGIVQARKALPYIEERSASYMESWGHM